MARYGLAGALIATAAIVTACSESTNTQPAEAAQPTAPPTTAAASGTIEPGKSPRGLLVKTVGETAEIGYPDQTPVVAWTVTDISVDGPCTGSFAETAENGHFVTLTIEAETSREYDDSNFGGFAPGNYWQIVDSSGVTDPHPGTDPAYSCHKSDWPVEMSPGSKYRFRITLDSTTPHGVATFTPSGTSAGWEWKF